MLARTIFLKRAYPSLTLASVVCAVAVTVYIVAQPTAGYGAIAVLPLAYAVIVGLTSTAARGAPSLLLIGLTVVTFLRYVALPALVTFNGGYVGRSWMPPTNDSLTVAIVLMAYELAAVMAVAAFMEGRLRYAGARAEPSLQHSLPLWVSIALLGASGMLCLLSPQAKALVSFVQPTIMLDETVASPQATLFAMIFVLSKLFLCVGLMHRCYLYQGRHQAFMPWLALLIAIVNITIFFGSNRLAILLNAVASVIFMLRYFGPRAMMPSMAAAIVFAIVFHTVTVERQYYDSGEPPAVASADQIQAYTGGVYNVAIGIEIAELFPDASRPSVLLYDFIRPTIGLNIISRNWEITYSNIYFNQRMFMETDRRSQIMPMVAQSNLFFGPMFSPILSMIFILLGYVLLHKSFITRWPELSFCLTLISLRTSFVFGQNSMNIMNFISLYLLLPAMIIGAITLTLRLGKAT